ncbi:NAD-dependent epimerase/dehydratase family protein [Shewanella surugensis]|uniref:NAD-dependent epimerase/dehydratase family protein n=1 Tax=Shewanella surugensis TaxID=212020 RepID=A0ABT0L7R4_9GAMM|nr:NAD-dependent epimerase/dehydratase family protein [Shewanella surugensis]MCL1123724.1 NAD-dependent epimerase/dehydratase family protein [Shewanella surugensis]
MNHSELQIPCLKTFNVKEQAALIELKSRVRRVFVTGAGGFLGRAICERLIAADIPVTGFARGGYPELTALGVNMIQGDITDKLALMLAMKECDLVFHVASKAGIWGSKQSYFSANVIGTDNVLEACQQLSIATLVYTSTPSVTFSGVDEAGIDESAPYADPFLNHYGESKAIAEQKVLAANATPLAEQGYLSTVALRPHLIWGPRDPHLVPRVIERAQRNKLKLVGMKDKQVDTLYIANAAYAHLLAALALTQPRIRNDIELSSRLTSSQNQTQSIKAAGKAYFISNDEPITMVDMLNRILACKGLPEVSQRVPSSLAYVVGAALELSYRLLRKQNEPIMTRFVARQLSTHHYFDISAAKQDLGYTPLISIDEGMQLLKCWLDRDNSPH